MLRQIAVPLDGSRFSEMALPTARRLAERAGAMLTLIKVHEPVPASVPAADLPTAGPEDLDLRSAEEGYLTDLARGLGPMAGGKVGIELIDGVAGQALMDWVSRKLPDLIVMATHGRGSLSRFWLGSVADHMIRHAAVPVMLVRPLEAEGGRLREYPMAHGLIALDRSDEALAVLEPAVKVALASGSRLTLLTVVEPILGVESMPPYPVPVPEGFLESLRAESLAHLEAAAERVRARGIEVDTKVVVKTGVAAAILDELDQGGADFIAMTTHGAGGLKRFLIGSVADKVVRAATKPVIVVRRESQTGKDSGI